MSTIIFCKYSVLRKSFQKLIRLADCLLKRNYWDVLLFKHFLFALKTGLLSSVLVLIILIINLLLVVLNIVVVGVLYLYLILKWLWRNRINKIRLFLVIGLIRVGNLIDSFLEIPVVAIENSCCHIKILKVQDIAQLESHVHFCRW